MRTQAITPEDPRHVDPPRRCSDHGPMSRLLRYAFLLLLALGSVTTHAQDGASPPPPQESATPAQKLDQLGKQLDAIQLALKGKKTDIPLAQLRTDAISVEDQARDLSTSIAPQMAALQPQLSVLGPAPAADQPPESREVSAERRKLNKVNADLDAQLKQAQLLNQEATQLATQITGMRNDQFQARMAERTATPFSTAFWADPARAFPDDVRRLRLLGSRSLDAWKASWQPANRTPLVICLIGALLLLAIGRWLLERWLLRVATQRVPAGHLRRSALAVAVALLSVFTTGMAAQLVYLGINWNDTLGNDLNALARSIVGLVLFSAFMVGLGRALLSVNRPSWRLPNLSEPEARCLRPFPWLLAASALLRGLFELINRAIGSSLPATVATRAFIALLIGALIGAALIKLRHARQQVSAEGEKSPPRPVWVSVLSATATLGALVSWFGVATGYISLGFFVARQMISVGVIVLTLYLLIHLLQDLFSTLLSPDSNRGKYFQATFDLSPNTLNQATVVLSGLSRLMLMLIAVVVVLAPFNAGPRELLTSASRIFGGSKLGSLPIHPGSIVNGLLVLIVGWLILRMLKRWLTEQLLPNTSMAPGMRDSIVTLLGYVGGLVVFVLTLAVLQVDLTSITWIVSALSVGIGFGLQAIVSNFISGLILLTERPVKAGDWISIDNGAVEGDVLRINVRATEILQWDRSTVIVPNSQLITQNVRNVTTTRALGRVKFSLPMPLDTDASRAREIILDALRSHPSILDEPEPYVRLESITANCMTFHAYAYTGNPRDIFGIKSDLQFSVLEQLRSQKMRLIRPQDMRMYSVPPTDAPSEDQHQGG
jgi:potassium efflux system protein